MTISQVGTIFTRKILKIKCAIITGARARAFLREENIVTLVCLHAGHIDRAAYSVFGSRYLDAMSFRSRGRRLAEERAILLSNITTRRIGSIFSFRISSIVAGFHTRVRARAPATMTNTFYFNSRVIAIYVLDIKIRVARAENNCGELLYF